MIEVFRTTRPICGVLIYEPVKGHKDSTAHKKRIDWSKFTFDSNRMVWIMNPFPLDKEVWIYTNEFLKDWEHELENKIYVIRDDAKAILAGSNVALGLKY